MRKLGNTLFVTMQGAWLAKDGTNVVIRVDKKEQFRAPIQLLDSIVCFGNVSCSPFLMGFCGEQRVGLSFLTENGRFLARIQGPQSGNVLLRRAQHLATTDLATACRIARLIIMAKIANARSLLLRSARDRPKSQPDPISKIEHAIRQMKAILPELEKADSLDRIRGIEGIAAQYYFSVFDHLVLVEESEFRFRGRNKRPPLDHLNALLSFLYTMLAHDAVSACEAIGLDPQMGFFHTDRPGRNSLALDLMEEFRPMIDRFILSLVNRRQVKPDGFQRRESGEIRMDENTRKTVLMAYQNRKKEEILHPFLKEKVPVGLLLYVQAQLLARYLRGDLDAYPPFLGK